MKGIRKNKPIGRILLSLSMMLAWCMGCHAQNVTISPQTGSLVAALTGQNETGFENGWSAMWRHEQLPLTLTVSDDADLTEGGELQNPTGNIREIEKNATIGNKLVVAGGQSKQLHMVLSLPKGYRITGYRLVVLNNLNNYRVGSLNFRDPNKTIYETGSDFDYTNYLAKSPTMNGTNSDTQEFVIERTSMNSNDMGNQIYFRVVHDESVYYMLTIKEFEVYFTAEGTFSAEVAPEAQGPLTSCVASPFKTSKIDIGEVKSRTKNGRTYYAYDYRNVKDLIAYNYLYQDDAVEDGVPADVADEKNILPVKVGEDYAYALKNDVYYVETPIEITNQSGNVSPIGYRIVGALFNYAYGTATEGYTMDGDEHFYITYTSGNTTYYLNENGRFTTSKTTEWETTDEGYIKVKDVDKYICYSSSGGWSPTYSLSIGNSNTSQKATLYNNQHIRIGISGFISTTYYYLQGSTSASTTPTYTTSNSGRAVWTTETDVIHVPGYTPGSYTLNVYDKTGTSIKESVEVSSSNASGMIDLGKCNNDAVKFSITGLDEGKMALVSVTLLLQALDPYIDKMDIECTDELQALKLKQSFTADDFSVSGGKFIFHIPTDYVNEELTFTFKDLYSKYGDNTYYDGTGTGNGRYSYVTSDYFFPVNGNNNGGLYDAAYSANAPYNNKVYTSTAGNIRFKFNNAEDLSNTGGETATGYLEEYPFSVTNYLGSDDPDEGTAKGDFIECHLNAGITDQKSGVFYVFTADETRWNIAPSTAWQHRYYAYYRMEIELKAQTFIPKLAWTKIYDETLCENNGAIDDKSMWGVKLSTEEEGTSLDVGYLTYHEIINAINEALDENNETAPASADQILYVDGSELYSMVNSTIKNAQNEDETISMENLQDILAPNAIVFLPENNTSTLDNVAYKTASGGFHAGKDIVLTDKKPFYTPYDIQVDAANYARYDRLISIDKNGKVTKATIIMPFNFTVDEDGQHTNELDGTIPFAVHQMQASDCLDVDQEKATVAYFPLLTNVTVTEPNTPYLIEVLNQSSDSKINFVLTQKGALIKSTSTMADDYTFEGETATGTAGGNNYTFKHLGGYAGKKLPIGEHYFYYSKNKFVGSDDLEPSLEYAKIQPFRTFYKANGGGANMMPFFDVVLGEGGNNETNGITEKTSNPDLRIKTGYRTMTLISGKAQTINLCHITGTMTKVVKMDAGDTVTLNIPSGIYVVNGVKITVK